MLMRQRLPTSCDSRFAVRYTHPPKKQSALGMEAPTLPKRVYRFGLLQVDANGGKLQRRVRAFHTGSPIGFNRHQGFAESLSEGIADENFS
jgi:hypothetical protein